MNGIVDVACVGVCSAPHIGCGCERAAHGPNCFEAGSDPARLAGARIAGKSLSVAIRIVTRPVATIGYAVAIPVPTRRLVGVASVVLDPRGLRVGIARAGSLPVTRGPHVLAAVVLIFSQPDSRLAFSPLEILASS